MFFLSLEMWFHFSFWTTESEGAAAVNANLFSVNWHLLQWRKAKMDIAKTLKEQWQFDGVEENPEEDPKEAKNRYKILEKTKEEEKWKN